MPFPQKSTKISQPIAIEPRLRDILEKHGVRKPPVVDKMEVLEKYATAKKWLFYTSPDREDGLVHIRLECPGADGLINYEAVALTTALAMTHALCDALESQPQQADMFDEAAKKPPKHDDRQQTFTLDEDFEPSGANAHFSDTGDEAGDDDPDDAEFDPEQKDLEDVLDDALAAESGDDMIAAAGADDPALLDLIDEFGDPEALDAEDALADELGEPDLTDDEAAIHDTPADDDPVEDDDTDVQIDRRLFRVNVLDRDRWLADMPAHVRLDASDDAVRAGFYLEFGFSYNEADGEITDASTGEIVYSRAVPAAAPSSNLLTNVAPEDENHWHVSAPRPITCEADASGAWTFALNTGFRYVPELGVIFDVLMNRRWIREFPKLGCEGYPDVPMIEDLAAELERREIVVTSLRESADFPTLYVDSDTLEYYIESVNRAGGTDESTQPDEEIEAVFHAGVLSGKITKTDRLVELEKVLAGYAEDEEPEHSANFGANGSTDDGAVAHIAEPDVEEIIAAQESDEDIAGRLDPRYPNYESPKAAESPESSAEIPDSLDAIRAELQAMGADVDRDGVGSLPSAGRGRKSKERISLEERYETLKQTYYRVSMEEEADAALAPVRNGGDLPRVSAGVTDVEVEALMP